MTNQQIKVSGAEYEPGIDCFVLKGSALVSEAQRLRVEEDAAWTAAAEAIGPQNGDWSEAWASADRNLKYLALKSQREEAYQAAYAAKHIISTLD